MTGNIAGKIVVITGASSGLGESTACHLAELCAMVVLGARRKDRLDAILKDIQAAGGKALPVTVDVTKPACVWKPMQTRFAAQSSLQPTQLSAREAS